MAVALETTPDPGNDLLRHIQKTAGGNTVAVRRLASIVYFDKCHFELIPTVAAEDREHAVVRSLCCGRHVVKSVKRFQNKPDRTVAHQFRA